MSLLSLAEGVTAVADPDNTSRTLWFVVYVLHLIIAGNWHCNVSLTLALSMLTVSMICSHENNPRLRSAYYFAISMSKRMSNNPE